MSILQQLRQRERDVSEIRSFILDSIKASGHFLSIIQIQDMVLVKYGIINIAELHSFMYGLLSTNKVVSCGPLYGAHQKDYIII
jgi:hypothetical protein